MTGALLVDKPGGLTSHDVVARVRRIARERRCGHTGTLDPFATGLLVLCLGRATRLARFVSGADKGYEATVRFGFPTDSYDRTGVPLGPDSGASPERERLLEALEAFRGAQLQHPPPFSAKRIGGKRSYELARAGVLVRPDPVRVEIHELRLLDFHPPRARIRVSVSTGTYVRSIAHDLGERLGCGAHLEELRRTHVGSFSVLEAATLETLEALSRSARLGERLLSPSETLRDLPRVTVSEEGASRLAHGRELPWEGREPDGISKQGGHFLRAEDFEGRLVAVVELDANAGLLRPAVVTVPP